MGLKNLFFKKKKEAPKPFKLPPIGGENELPPLKPLPGPKKDLEPIKEMTFPKLPGPEPLMQPRPQPKPLELSSEPAGRQPEPHLFVKVDRYQQVRETSKKLAERLKDLTGTLEKLENLKKEEEQRLEVLRQTLKQMSDVASELDKTFRAAREEYE
jgi:hypothetical protein